MKYIKLYEGLRSILEMNESPNIYKYDKYLYPIKLNEISDWLYYFNKNKVDIKLYEINPEAKYYTKGDIFIFFEDYLEGKIDNWIKNRSYLVTNKKIKKLVGQQIKIEDIDLYISAQQYNL